MLIYGMEVCPLTKSDLRALDFVVDRFFMKLFQTSNMEVMISQYCQYWIQLSFYFLVLFHIVFAFSIIV